MAAAAATLCKTCCCWSCSCATTTTCTSAPGKQCDDEDASGPCPCAPPDAPAPAPGRRKLHRLFSLTGGRTGGNRPWSRQLRALPISALAVAVAAFAVLLRIGEPRRPGPRLGAATVLGAELALLCAALAFSTCAAGLRLELTHVDAKENCTTKERMRRATERTHRRLASMAGGEASAPIHWNESQYITEYHIGDPPQQAAAIIDTGSNLIWTQCSTCRAAGCFSQILSFYDPSRSRTTKPVVCNDMACALGSETQSARDNKACAMLTAYSAGVIGGVLGTEVLTFGQSENVSLAFGCITASSLTPGSLDGASGIIGLGRGKLSLPSQLGDNRFSYCLTPYFSDAANTSRLFVGASAGLSSGLPVTSVLFLKNPDVDPFDTFYYLPLTGIMVGTAKFAVPVAAFDLREVAPAKWAGTLIDSGSPFMSLVDVAYQALRDELVRQLGASVVPPPAEAEGLDLCVGVAHGDAGKLVPPLVLHFGSGSGSGGGDVVVPPENYWAPVDDTTACLVVFSTGGPNSTLPLNETTIIGNYMQQDMQLLYDLQHGVLSIQPADCSSV